MDASRRRMEDPTRAADDDAPFSESMLEWLEEGDRMGDGHPGAAPRPSGQYQPLERANRRTKFVIGGVFVAAGAFVLALRLIGGHKPAGEEGAKAVAAATPAPAPAHAAAPSAPPPAAEP